MPHVAVLFHRIGPYHFARLRAAGCSMRVAAIELCDKDSIYDWNKVCGADGFRRLTLFAGEDEARDFPREVWKRLCQSLDSLAPEVVAIPGWAETVSLMALRWCALRKVSAVAMSETTFWDERRRWWREAMKRRVVGRFSSGLVGGSPHTDYLACLGMPRDRIFPGYDAVDNAYFAAGAEEAKRQAATIRSRFGLPERYFLASARFIEKKNLSALIEAYARYRERAASAEGRIREEKPWDLVILGEGTLSPGVGVADFGPRSGGLRSAPGFQTVSRSARTLRLGRRLHPSQPHGALGAGRK